MGREFIWRDKSLKLPYPDKENRHPDPGSTMPNKINPEGNAPKHIVIEMVTLEDPQKQ